MLAYVALLGDDAVPQAGIFLPQTREHFPQGAAVRINLDLAPASGVFPQRDEGESWSLILQGVPAIKCVKAAETPQRSRLGSEFRTKAPFIVPTSTRALPFFGLTNVFVSTEPPGAFIFFPSRYRTMPATTLKSELVARVFRRRLVA